MKNKWFYFGIFIFIFIFSFFIINNKNKNFNIRKNQLYSRKIIDDTYVRMYPNDTVLDVGNYFGLSSYTVTNKNNVTKNNNEKLATGDILKYNSKNYQIAVTGDVAADGIVKYSDVIKLYHAYIGKITLSGAELKAADVINDNAIKYNDVIKLYHYYIGKISTLYEGEIFVITFMNTANNTTSTKTIEPGKSLGTLPSPTREGYSLQGWYTASSGGTKVESSTVPTNTTTYYTHWQINQYTVSFDGNGGSNGASITRNYNEQIGTLPTSSRTGYTFKGWYTAKTGGTKIESTSRIPSKDTTYYARWQVNQYTLTFNGNGGSNGTSITKNYDTQIGTLPNSTRSYTVTFSPNGQGVNLDKAKETINYTLNGWYTATTGGTKITSATMMPAQNTTYYAQWTPNGITLAEVTKSGFQCTWNTKADGTGTKYNSKQANYITDKNITLYAMCERLYTASFNGNGGSNGTSIKRVANAELGTLPSSTRTNTITYNGNNQGATLSATSSKVTYDFLGWYTASSGGSKISSTTKMPTDNVTYYAHWGSNSGTLAIAVKGGYVCKWNTKADGTGTAYNGGQVDFSTDKDITLYADCDVYYVARFDGNGGSNGTALYVKPGEKLGDLPTSHRVHIITYDKNGSGATTGTNTGSVIHTFNGWFTSASGGTQVTSNTTMPSNDVKYYAHWTAGTTTLTTISRKGHTCTWNTQKDGKGTDYESAKTNYTISDDVTLYGKCIPNIYTLKYNVNNGVGTYSDQIYIYSDTGSINLHPTAPTRTGYKFKGWKLGSTTYQAGGKYNRNNDSDVTLTADWEGNTYKIVYHANGGSGSMSDQTMHYGTAANLTSNTFTNAGADFVKWNTKADGSGTSYNNEQSVSNLTTTDGATIDLYAIWKHQDAIYFLNVGSSDAIIIQSEGKVGLIDASNPNNDDIPNAHSDAPDCAKTKYSDATNNGTKVKNYLQTLGISHLDFVMASHDHSDHIGGIPELVNNSSLVDNNTVFIYKPNFVDTGHGEVTEGGWCTWFNDDYFNAAKDTMSSHGAIMLDTSTHSGAGMNKLGASFIDNSDSYKQGITFSFGNYNIKIYNLYTTKSPSGDTTDENSNSLVTLITGSNGKKVLTSGDLNTIYSLEQRYASFIGHVDVLKANHHGYHYSNSKGLFDATTPSVVIVPNNIDLLTTSHTSGSVSEFGAARLYLKNTIGAKVYKTGDSTDAVVVKFGSSDISIYNASGKSLSSMSEMSSSVPNGWHAWYNDSDYQAWTIVENNTIVKEKYAYLNGKYHWVDSQGFWDEKYYTFQGSGTSWRFGNEDGSWYASNEWLELNGKWYYFKDDTYAAVGWTQIGSYWYYFNSDCQMIKGWYEIEGRWYYFDENGHMLTGWQTIGDYKYYFYTTEYEKSGAMAKHEYIGGSWIDSSGHWDEKPVSSWHGSGSSQWYGYGTASGEYASNACYYIDTEQFCFDVNGYCTSGRGC